MSNVTALGRLIETAGRVNRRSMQDAADLATSHGAPISKSMISESARGVETITPKVIRGIAAGYEIPAEDVARAMLADIGVAITDYSVDAESAIRRDPELSSDVKAMLLAAIGAARKSVGPAHGVAGAHESQDAPRGGRIIGRGSPSEDARVRRNKESS